MSHKLFKYLLPMISLIYSLNLANTVSAAQDTLNEIQLIVENPTSANPYKWCMGQSSNMMLNLSGISFECNNVVNDLPKNIEIFLVPASSSDCTNPLPNSTTEYYLTCDVNNPNGNYGIMAYSNNSSVFNTKIINNGDGTAQIQFTIPDTEELEQLSFNVENNIGSTVMVDVGSGFSYSYEPTPPLWTTTFTAHSLAKSNTKGEITFYTSNNNVRTNICTISAEYDYDSTYNFGSWKPISIIRHQYDHTCSIIHENNKSILVLG